MSEIKRRGLMFILSAPSGTGKTTLSKLLLANDNHLHSSVSVTTRKQRQGEKEGLDYFYTDVDSFKTMVANGDFLEYAEVFGKFYGTPRFTVEKFLDNGEDVLFDIDWQGHRQLVATARDDVTSVFLLPPSKFELVSRLKFRNSDSDEILRQRIDAIDEEISHWHEYDYIIINRNIEESFQKLMAILKAERLRKARRTGLPKFIGEMMLEDVKNLVIETKS